MVTEPVGWTWPLRAKLQLPSCFSKHPWPESKGKLNGFVSGMELAFLTDQMPIRSGSRASDIQTSIHLGGQEQRQGSCTVQMDLESFPVPGVLALLSPPSNWPSVARKTSKPFSKLSWTDKATGSGLNNPCASEVAAARPIRANITGGRCQSRRERGERREKKQESRGPRMREHTPLILEALEGVASKVQKSQEPQEAWHCLERLSPTLSFTSDLGHVSAHLGIPVVPSSSHLEITGDNSLRSLKTPPPMTSLGLGYKHVGCDKPAPPRSIYCRMRGSHPVTIRSSLASKTSSEENKFNFLSLFSLQYKVTEGDSANGVLWWLKLAYTEAQCGPRGRISRGGSPVLCTRVAHSSYCPSQQVLPVAGARSPSVDVPSPPRLPFQQKLWE